jgi:hypothetical protein
MTSGATKRIDDMDKTEIREVGEKLYSGTKDAYTAGGTLVATIEGAIVSLGTFTGGTFEITADGRKRAQEMGLVRRDEEQEPVTGEAPTYLPYPAVNEPGAPGVGGEAQPTGPAQNPEDYKDLFPDRFEHTSLSEEQPPIGHEAEGDPRQQTADKRGHPQAPPELEPGTVEVTPYMPDDAHRVIPEHVSTGSGDIPPRDEADPNMGSVLPSDKDDFDEDGTRVKPLELKSRANTPHPSQPIAGQPPQPTHLDEYPDNAATLPAMNFGDGPVHPIAQSFPSPGGGSPEYPIMPGPAGTQPPPPPRPDVGVRPETPRPPLKAGVPEQEGRQLPPSYDPPRPPQAGDIGLNPAKPGDAKKAKGVELPDPDHVSTGTGDLPPPPDGLTEEEKAAWNESYQRAQKDNQVIVEAEAAAREKAQAKDPDVSGDNTLPTPPDQKPTSDAEARKREAERAAEVTRQADKDRIENRDKKAEEHPGLVKRAVDALTGKPAKQDDKRDDKKDDKSSKPKGKTQGRNLKLDLKDNVKATSKTKTS